MSDINNPEDTENAIENNDSETVRVTPRYGLCCYVPLEHDDGSITLEAAQVLCGTRIIDGQENISIFEPFINLAEVNNKSLSFTARALSYQARKISKILLHAASHLEEEEPEV